MKRINISLSEEDHKALHEVKARLRLENLDATIGECIRLTQKILKRVEAENSMLEEKT